MRNKLLTVLLMGVMDLTMVSSLSAYDASPRCYRELQLHFFRPELVQQALSMHHVPQSAWIPITQVLTSQSTQVPRYIREKARRMQPNPFDPVFLPEVALGLIEETLFQIFSTTMAPYMNYQAVVINQGDIADMFRYIRNKQEKAFLRCFPHLETDKSP